MLGDTPSVRFGIRTRRRTTGAPDNARRNMASVGREVAERNCGRCPTNRAMDCSHPYAEPARACRQARTLQNVPEGRADRVIRRRGRASHGVVCGLSRDRLIDPDFLRLSSVMSNSDFFRRTGISQG